MDLTLQFLIATTDFLTAIELGKTYPEINTSKEVITKFTDEFGLPNNGITAITELEKVLVDNLFTELVPTSLKLHYWETKYFFVDAMRLAAANNDTVFLDKYREHFDPELSDILEAILHLLYNVELDKNRRSFYVTDEIIFLTDHGYLEKILPANLKSNDNKMVYLQQILRKENWKMFSDISRNNFEILEPGPNGVENLNKEIFIGLLASGNVENLKNPPKEITSLKGWKVDKEYYAGLCYDFPLNLPNAEFVDYFKEEILRLGSQPIQDLLDDSQNIEYCEGFEAVFKLFPPKSIFMNDINDLPTGRAVSPRDETKIVELFGSKPLNYHNFYLSTYLGEEMIYGIAHLRILEFIRLKGNPKKIREYLEFYLETYPDPILHRELEKLDKCIDLYIILVNSMELRRMLEKVENVKYRLIKVWIRL